MVWSRKIGLPLVERVPRRGAAPTVCSGFRLTWFRLTYCSSRAWRVMTIENLLTTTQFVVVVAAECLTGLVTIQPIAAAADGGFRFRLDCWPASGRNLRAARGQPT